MHVCRLRSWRRPYAQAFITYGSQAQIHISTYMSNFMNDVILMDALRYVLRYVFLHGIIKSIFCYK